MHWVAGDDNASRAPHPIHRTDYPSTEPTIHPSATVSSRAPLDGIDLLLIDANNLLHRRRQGIGESALRGLLVELQRKLPSGVRAEVILDGHPDAGAPLREKIGQALELRHSGGSADDAIVATVSALPWAVRGRTIVVTDDRALSDRSRAAGALHRRLDWLEALRPASVSARTATGASIGAGKRPPRPHEDRRRSGR